MATISERNRARLAVRLLDPQQEPREGDHVLIWARIDSCGESGHLLATVTAQLRSRAFTEQRLLVDRSDVVLTTTERP